MKVRRIMITGAAALAACGVLGMVPPAVQASSAAAATWTRQLPAVHPPPRSQAAMAYDAATGTAVLFGGSTPPGQGNIDYFGDTWTWDGTTWTRQHPAVHPTVRNNAAMAYDAATGTVVLFGGFGPIKPGTYSSLDDTWTWDGSTWTQQHPAVRPPAQVNTAMAYDAATGTVVLVDSGGHDTWTWDGTTWTKQATTTSPAVLASPAMAYDAATGTVVLLGDTNPEGTWSWNGKMWAKKAPAASSPVRFAAAMAYDAATGTVVLFGGNSGGGPLGDTWTWDGTTWTQQHPATSPKAQAYPAMAYDAATGTVVLFSSRLHPQTWTWG